MLRRRAPRPKPIRIHRSSEPTPSRVITERRTNGNHDHRRAAGRLQEHDRPRAQRVPEGVRRGVRRDRRGPGGSRGPRRRRRRGEAAAAEEQDEFDVVLAAAGDKKIQVIKEVRALTSLGLKEAKDLVDAAPKPVLEKVVKEDADKAKAQLEGRRRQGRAQVADGPERVSPAAIVRSGS